MLVSKLAKEIEGCEDCPLYGYDCKPNIPEGPCHSWRPDDVISRGMYEFAYEMYEEQVKQRRIKQANITRKNTRQFDDSVKIVKAFLSDSGWDEVLFFSRRQKYYVYLRVKFQCRANVCIDLRNMNVYFSTNSAPYKNKEADETLYNFAVLHGKQVVRKGYKSATCKGLAVLEEDLQKFANEIINN